MKRVHTAAAALIKEGKALLGFRSAHKTLAPNTWDLIGGHCENSETLDQTLRRELLEEIGVTPKSFKHVATVLEDVGKSRYAHNLFVVTNWEGIPTNCSDEHMSIEWFTIEEMRSLELALDEYTKVFESYLQQCSKRET